MLAIAASSCAVRMPVTFQNPFDRDVPGVVFDPLALGPLVVWDYTAAQIVSGCPDPANPGANPGCDVVRFMVWDGSQWSDAGLQPWTGPETYQFRLQDTYDPVATQVLACNDTGTVPGAWDQADGCSMGAARLMLIAPPTNPRFLP